MTLTLLALALGTLVVALVVALLAVALAWFVEDD